MTQLSRWEKAKAVGRQWLKFNAVGAMGILVQLIILTIMTHLARINYLVSTMLGVEAAVIHNFVWHERWTWAHRAQGGTKEMLQRLMKFNFTTGAFSILGNLFFMRIFVGSLRMAVLPANLLTIGACNFLNFAVSELFVFRSQRLQQ